MVTVLLVQWWEGERERGGTGAWERRGTGGARTGGNDETDRIRRDYERDIGVEQRQEEYE